MYTIKQRIYRYAVSALALRSFRCSRQKLKRNKNGALNNCRFNRRSKREGGFDGEVKERVALMEN